LGFSYDKWPLTDRPPASINGLLSERFPPPRRREMKCEYLIFNLLVIAGPVAATVGRRAERVARWPAVLLSVVLAMIPYVIWDALVTNRHWSFSESYTLGVRVAGLPIEEWLFFVTVPSASLFIWEGLSARFEIKETARLQTVRVLLGLGIPVGALVFATGKEYTGLALIAVGIVAVLDRLLAANLLLQARTYLFLLIVCGLVLLFNGYLTARPVVIYNASYQLGVRVVTIPIEDFLYGLSLMFLNALVYEKIRNRMRVGRGLRGRP